ncbi:hypothetical protein RJZ56_003757 [Blastomyces dermatitidis]
MSSPVVSNPRSSMAVADNSPEASDFDLAEIWEAILRPGAAEDEQFVIRYYNWGRPLSIQTLFGHPRTWMSWSYRAAYPKLSTLLEQTSLENKLRCRVNFEELTIDTDRYVLRKLSYNEAHAPLSVIFDSLREISSQTTGESHSVKIKGTALVKSLDISHVAAFVDRNLNGLNWAKVNLLQTRNTGWSSYVYEYHFSFYFVTLDYFEPDTVKPDPRKIRRSCSFGKRKGTKHRYIHEETVSFLLCGHFDDAFTCYQLGDTYFKPRYTKDTGPRFFRSYDPSQSPGQLLLHWIAVALFHARSRWENAIDSLQSEIRAPSDVVFMEDRSDLMADDPQFSLSKTYFWALQTYKLFERTLEQTITTWETFKIDSLPKIQDGRISPENWDASVSSIDQSIELLKPKIDRIKRGMQDVRDLRESGIFSMQLIEPSATTINAFAITLPVITIVSALLIFNLNSLTAAFDSVVRKATFGLQRQMRLHHRKEWKHRALALHQDDISTEPPVRKASKESSHWVYILFLIETAVVVTPVSELNAALNCYGLFGFEGEKAGEGEDDEYSDNEDASTHQPRKDRQKEVLMRVKRAAREAEEQERKRKDEESGMAIGLLRRFYRYIGHLGRVLGHTVLTSFRILLLPIWVVLLLVEYILTVLTLTLLFDQPPYQANPSSATHGEESPESHPSSPFARAWHALGLNTLTLPTRHHHPHDLSYCPRLLETQSHEHALSRIQSEEQAPRLIKLPALQRPAPAITNNERREARHTAKRRGEHSPERTLDRISNVEVSVFDPARSRRTARSRISRAVNAARYEAGVER